MTAPFIRACTELLARTCHRHGAVAVGGMAAFVPSRTDHPDQLDRTRDDVSVTADQPLDIASAGRSNPATGLRTNLCVAIAYPAVGRSGNDAVAIDSRTEDATSAEIHRSVESRHRVDPPPGLVADLHRRAHRAGVRADHVSH